MYIKLLWNFVLIIMDNRLFNIEIIMLMFLYFIILFYSIN